VGTVLFWAVLAFLTMKGIEFRDDTKPLPGSSKCCTATSRKAIHYKAVGLVV
jgi:hypothetical protein